MSGIADESNVLTEYWDLLRSPVYWGVGIPRGDRRLVLVLPGLFGNDFYLRPIRAWLRRTGYQPAMSTLSVNAGCSNRLSDQIEQAFAARLQRHSGEVAIIGHSRGGMLGKAILNRLGERCTHFIALGSPVGGLMRYRKAGLHSLATQRRGSTTDVPDFLAKPVARVNRRARSILDPECDSPFCGCGYIQDLLAPFPRRTKVTAIFSKHDPIVPSSASIIDGATNIEVSGTHIGLVFNRTVYGHIARALQ